MVKIKSTATETNIEIDVKWMLAYEDIDVAGIYCRGNTGAMPSLP